MRRKATRGSGGRRERALHFGHGREGRHQAPWATRPDHRSQRSHAQCRLGVLGLPKRDRVRGADALSSALLLVRWRHLRGGRWASAVAHGWFGGRIFCHSSIPANRPCAIGYPKRPCARSMLLCSLKTGVSPSAEFSARGIRTRRQCPPPERPRHCCRPLQMQHRHPRRWQLRQSRQLKREAGLSRTARLPSSPSHP
jgi:hypothetical protein